MDGVNEGAAVVELDAVAVLAAEIGLRRNVFDSLDLVFLKGVLFSQWNGHGSRRP